MCSVNNPHRFVRKWGACGWVSRQAAAGPRDSGVLARLAVVGAGLDVPELLRVGIAGGAVYDALVALAAKEHGAPLATRDARARGTYDAVGVKVIVVP